MQKLWQNVGLPSQHEYTIVVVAWYHSFTAVNIMSGFKKCGVYPINPGEVTDRQLAPSKAFRHQSPQLEHQGTDSEDPLSNSSSSIFSPEEEALYRKRYEEQYDLDDPSYVAWLKINHPEDAVSAVTGSSSLPSAEQQSYSSKSGGDNIQSSSSHKSKVSCTDDVLSEVLVHKNMNMQQRYTYIHKNMNM